MNYFVELHIYFKDTALTGPTIRLAQSWKSTRAALRAGEGYARRIDAYMPVKLDYEHRIKVVNEDGHYVTSMVA